MSGAIKQIGVPVLLLILILFHVLAVITLEVRKGGNIISAMFTGRKTRPSDLKPEKEFLD